MYSGQDIDIEIDISNTVNISIEIDNNSILEKKFTDNLKIKFKSEYIGYLIIEIDAPYSVNIDYKYEVSGIPIHYIIGFILAIFLLFVAVLAILFIKPNDVVMELEKASGKSLPILSTIRIELDKVIVYSTIIPIFLSSLYLGRYSSVTEMNPHDIVYVPDYEYAFFFYWFIKIFLLLFALGVPLLYSVSILDELRGRTLHEENLIISPKIKIFVASLLQFAILWPPAFILIIMRISVIRAISGYSPNIYLFSIIFVLSILISFTFLSVLNFLIWLFRPFKLFIFGFTYLTVYLFYKSLMSTLYQFKTSNAVILFNNALVNPEKYIPYSLVRQNIVNVTIVSLLLITIIFASVNKLRYIKNRIDKHHVSRRVLSIFN